MTGPVWAALLGVGPLGIHTAWLWRHAGQPDTEQPAPYDWATEPDQRPISYPTTYACHTAHIDQAPE